MNQCYRNLPTPTTDSWALSATGKVTLAFNPEAAEQVLSVPIRRYTPYTLNRPDQLLAALEQVRSSHLAFDREELRVGWSCVAAPIFGSDGSFLASIGVAAPTGRVRADLVAKQVATAAASISTNTVRSAAYRRRTDARLSLQAVR